MPMTDRMIWLAIVAFAVAGVATVVGASDLDELKSARSVEPRPVPGAQMFANIRYLPEGRQLGDMRLNKDHQWSMDLYVPDDGKASHPVVLYVHGGGFSEGDKSTIHSNGTAPLRDALLEAGFAFGSVNYPLLPHGMMPEAVYNTRDAVRYLRLNAAKYRIDPTAIGAVGISAGGWLLGAVEFPSTDSVIRRWDDVSHLSDESWNWHLKRHGYLKYRSGATRLWQPILNPTPDYDQVAGGFEAVSLDFQYHFDELTRHGELGFYNRMLGSRKDGSAHHPTVDSATDTDFSFSSIAEDKYRGKGVHAPSMNAKTWMADGKTRGTLAQRQVEFFRRALVTEARTPRPEFRIPTLRTEEPIDVRIVTAAKGIDVHYTLDGSVPTRDSLKYDGPVRVAPDQVIRARAWMAGKAPSPVIKAHISKGAPAPRIITPTDVALPRAAVGKAYEVQFKADQTGDLYWIAHGEFGYRGKGDERKRDDPSVEQSTVNGLYMNPRTGVLSGTPLHPGRYWLQVQVATKIADLGSLRNYTLIIDGEGGQTYQPPTVDDPNIVLCSFPPDADSAKVKQFADSLENSTGRIGQIIVQETEAGWLLLVAYPQAYEAATRGKALADKMGLSNISWEAIKTGK